MLDRASGSVLPTLSDHWAWPEATLLDGTPTAAVGVHLPTLRVSLCRDLMGQRPLVYARVPGGLIVASGEDILRAHPAISSELDDGYLAAFFAGLSPAPTETVFRDIRQVSSGAQLHVDAESERCIQSRLEPDYSWRGMPDQGVVDHFGLLLRSSVERACLGGVRVGISLSAGLDSSSIAALVSRQRPHSFAVTQGLPGYPDIDESTMAAELARSLGISHHHFAADQLLPFANAELHPVCPNHPAQSPFRAWKEISYRAMATAGVDVCLNGGFADDLFAGDVEWVANAIRFRRWRVLREQLADLASGTGLKALMQDTAVRRPLSRLLGRVSQHSDRLNWLRPPYRRRIEERLDQEARLYRNFPRPQQCMRLLGAAAAFDASAERWYAARHGLEQRQPFRDQQLTGWCLSLPADLFARHGQRKWLLREAMRGVLPDALRNRSKSSDLTPVFNALVAAQTNTLDHSFAASSAHRQRYLEPTAMDKMSGDDPAIARWLASSFGYWFRFFTDSKTQ